MAKLLGGLFGRDTWDRLFLLLASEPILIFPRLGETQERHGASLRRRLVFATYILSITTATLGWLSLIAWWAMKLI
jgi:hypothetical protein